MEKSLRPVSQYTADFKFIGRFQSVNEAAKAIGVSYSGVRNSCMRRGKYATGGFRFVYDGDAPYWEDSPEYRQTWEPVQAPPIYTQDGRAKYEVSNKGAVRSMARNAQVGRMLRVDCAGCVKLTDGAKTYIVPVTSLVEAAFC